jgi:hypothetical protein
VEAGGVLIVIVGGGVGLPRDGGDASHAHLVK